MMPNFVAHVAQVSRGNARANAVNSTDLVCSRLVRDQEVDGSNPFAPTTSFRANNLQQEKCRRHLGCVPRDRWFQCTRPTISISLCKLELGGVTLRLHFPHFVAHVAQTASRV